MTGIAGGLDRFPAWVNIVLRYTVISDGKSSAWKPKVFLRPRNVKLFQFPFPSLTFSVVRNFRNPPGVPAGVRKIVLGRCFPPENTSDHSGAASLGLSCHASVPPPALMTSQAAKTGTKMPRRIRNP